MLPTCCTALQRVESTLLTLPSLYCLQVAAKVKKLLGLSRFVSQFLPLGRAVAWQVIRIIVAQLQKALYPCTAVIRPLTL